MDETIRQDINHIIENTAEFQDDTVNALGSVLDYFLQQIVVELQNNHKQNEKIKPKDIPIALKTLNFSDAFIYNNEEAFNNYIQEQKTLKIKRLKEAGFGATNEHGQLHQRILESSHQSYVRNEDQEISIEETDDASEFDSA